MKRIKRLSTKLMLLGVGPIVLVGLAFIIYGNISLKRTCEDQAAYTLNGVCSHVRDEFSSLFPGGYHEEDGAYYAGSVNIAIYNQYLQKYKSEFNTEISIFFDNTRVMTTLTDDSGVSLIGTKQEDRHVISQVLVGHKTYMSDNVMIDGHSYHTIYMPLFEEDRVKGMVFAGISDASMERKLSVYRHRMIIAVMVMVVIMTVVVILVSRIFTRSLNGIKVYLGDLVSEKGTERKMPDSILALNDEIGDLGRYAVEIGEEFELLMGKDPLTGLFNRRAGRTILDKLWIKAQNDESTFSVVMSDIDHFKRVNDTYGHDVGDIVLKKIGELMQKRCQENADSYAIRWGGEEFLLALYMPLGAAINLATVLGDDIRKEEFPVEDGILKVTMTFGIASSKKFDDIHSIIIAADENLYKGKADGRDRVIF